jgi:hypothetical protein
MQITQEHKNRMETIIAEMKRDNVNCLKDFECYKSSLEKLCKVNGIGAFDMIQCLNKYKGCCGLSFSIRGESFCKCPLRRYISANFCR